MSNLTDGLTETQPLEGGAPTSDPVQGVMPGMETTGVEDVPPEPAPAPPVDYLDIDDDLAAKHVKVKVDGEEVDVPLQEALQGYQRQESYTRKTQELAEQRREASEAMQIQQALQANPALTMQVLAARAGVSVEEYLGMSSQQQAAPEPEPEFADPLERELYETRQQMQQLQRQFQDQQADQRLHGVVNGLKQQYNADDTEVREAVTQAANMGLGIDAVPMVYRAMAYDKVQAQQQAVADATTQRQGQEQQRQAAAAAAQQVTAAGQVSANGLSESAPSHKPSSTREAIEMAYEELDAKSRR